MRTLGAELIRRLVTWYSTLHYVLPSIVAPSGCGTVPPVGHHETEIPELLTGWQRFIMRGSRQQHTGKITRLGNGSEHRRRIIICMMNDIMCYQSMLFSIITIDWPRSAPSLSTPRAKAIWPMIQIKQRPSRASLSKCDRSYHDSSTSPSFGFGYKNAHECRICRSDDCGMMDFDGVEGKRAA